MRGLSLAAALLCPIPAAFGQSSISICDDLAYRHTPEYSQYCGGGSPAPARGGGGGGGLTPSQQMTLQMGAIGAQLLQQGIHNALYGDPAAKERQRQLQAQQAAQAARARAAAAARAEATKQRLLSEMQGVEPPAGGAGLQLLGTDAAAGGGGGLQLMQDGEATAHGPQKVVNFGVSPERSGLLGGESAAAPGAAAPSGGLRRGSADAATAPNPSGGAARASSSGPDDAAGAAESRVRPPAEARVRPPVEPPLRRIEGASAGGSSVSVPKESACAAAFSSCVDALEAHERALAELRPAAQAYERLAESAPSRESVKDAAIDKVKERAQELADDGFKVELPGKSDEGLYMYDVTDHAGHLLQLRADRVKFDALWKQDQKVRDAGANYLPPLRSLLSELGVNDLKDVRDKAQALKGGADDMRALFNAYMNGLQKCGREAETAADFNRCSKHMNTVYDQVLKLLGAAELEAVARAQKARDAVQGYAGKALEKMESLASSAARCGGCR